MEHDFSKGSVAKHIWQQSIPLIVAQLIQLLYNVVDRIYIGHLPVENGLALTGVGITFPVIFLITAFVNLYGMGGAPLCSIARGAGKIEKAEKIMGNTATLLFFSSFVIMIIFYLFEGPILYMFGASDATYQYAYDYLSIYLLGTVFVMIGTGLNYFITSQGFPKTAMVTTVMGAVINLILDPIFIFGLDMGVKGAALATIIAQFASWIWVLRFLYGKKSILHLRRECFHLDKTIVKDIISLGFASFIMSATSSIVQVVCNKTLKIYSGDIYIGIMTILNSVREIVTLPVSGINNGSQPIIGFNYGAEEYGRSRRGIFISTIISGTYCFIAWVVILAVPGLFIRIFVNNPVYLEYGRSAMRIYFSGLALMMLQFSGQSAFVALGKSKQAIFFSLFRKVVIIVPLTIWLPTVGNLGVNGVFLAEPISNLVGGLFCYSTMYFTVYKKLKAKETEKNLIEKQT